MKNRKLLFSISAILIAIFLASCNSQAENSPASTPASEPTPISEDNTVSASAEVIPEKWINLTFPAGGQNLAILVDVGHNVRGNQLLALVDEQGAVATLEAAKAQLANAQATLTRLEDAEADDADLSAAQAAVTAAQAGVDQANNVLAGTRLYSPFPGTIIDLSAQDTENISPGQPVILLADLSTLQVQTTDLSEVDAARVSVGDSAEVFVDALQDTTITGRVVQIALKKSTGSGVYFTATIALDHIPENLRWGMSAFVEITVTK